MLSRLFSNHLKIIKIKDRRLCWISYLKYYNLLKVKPDRYFSPQNSSIIYNYIFLCYLDCFQTI